MTTITPHLNPSADPATQAEPRLAVAGVHERIGVRPPADPALREAFERALARPPRSGTDDEEATAPPPAIAAPPADIAAIQARLRQPAPEELVFLSSQPADSVNHTVAGTGLVSVHSPASGPRPTPAVLGAALSALSMPASPEGIQHWQFSFSQPGSAISGVTLVAHPEAPWQVQVTLLPHALSTTQARERSALDARLGELRQRLLGRGAAIGDVELHDPLDDAHRR